MAKRNQPTISKQDIDRYKQLTDKIGDEIGFRTDATNTERKEELHSLMSEIEDVISDELKYLTDYTGTDMSRFFTTLFQNDGGKTFKTLTDLFESEGENGMATLFMQKFNDRNNTFKEIDMLATQLHELNEAILVTRDSICTADDLSQELSRKISFKGMSEEENMKLVSVVEDMEKNLKLQKKFKNFIVPNTLRYGEYYAYTISYEDLFKKYGDHAQKFNNGIKESTVLDLIDQESVNEASSTILEAVSEATIGNPSSSKHGTSKNSKKIVDAESITKSLNKFLGNYTVSNTDVPIPVFEGSDLASYMEISNNKNFAKEIEKRTRKSSKKNGGINQFADGTSDVNEYKNVASKRAYIKLIDPTRLIPVEIMDITLGYYYITEMSNNMVQPFSHAIRITGGAANTQLTEDIVISQLASRIVHSFDKKFLEQNKKFEELIINALMYNDNYRRQLRFQFIPAENIQKFICNEDEDGNGQSILKDSIYKAKLYLGLLIFKLMQIFTKSSDTRVYYVKNSGIDQDVVSNAQRVARSIKEGQLNYYDILNPNMSVSKIGKGRDVFMPTGRSGERAIEFDILQGQDVQLNTDLMEMLRTDYINATGVPSVMMNYINEADYVKTLVMANSKFVGRVISHQTDFSDALTEWYKMLLSITTDIEPHIINQLVVTLIQPRSLNNQNVTDLISGIQQTVQYMVETRYGNENDESVIKERDISARMLSKLLLPTLPWDDLEKFAEAAKLEIARDESSKENIDSSDDM